MRAHKYGATKVFRYGRNWPSKLELAIYEMLLLMQRAGKFQDIKCQVHVEFHTYEYGRIKMIPDFSAFEIAKKEVVYIEAKGFRTRDYVRKEKAWKEGGPGILYVYEGNWKYPKLTKIIVPKTKELDK